MVKFPFGGRKEPIAAVPNLNQLRAREEQLLKELQGIQAQIRGLQDEAKTFFEALQKEKHRFEYEEQVLKNFINKLTILMGQLALQFKAVAGFGKSGHIAYDHFNISLYDQIGQLRTGISNTLSDLGRKGNRPLIEEVYEPLFQIQKIIYNAQNNDGYSGNKDPQSILQSAIARALNDIMWIALQLKELKKLYSKEEKWRIAEDDISENCMKILNRLRVDKDVDVLVHSDSIHKAREVLAANDYYTHFGIKRVEHDIQSLLGNVNIAKREEEATQTISKQFGSLESKIDDIIRLIYQRLTRIHGYSQQLIYFLTSLRRVQEIDFPFLKFESALNSIYTYNRSVQHEYAIQVYARVENIQNLMSFYNTQVINFKAAVEKKLTLMQAIDRKMRDGFDELNAMINANKALSIVRGREEEVLHELIGGTKALESELRRSRRGARKKR